MMPNQFSTKSTLIEEPQVVRRFERSEMVQEIVSNKPGLIIRYGTMAFFFILIFLCIACWFIQYPDMVKANARLSSINGPKEVITKTPGKLIKLFAKEGEITSSGKILGYIESTASHQEIIALSKDIRKLQTILNENNFAGLISYKNMPYQQLGELQPSFQIFLQSFAVFNNYITDGFYLRKRSMLSKDFSYLQKLHSIILQQKVLNEQDLALSQKTFDANESLNTDKVISDFDYRSEKSKLINKKLSLPQINAAIVSNEAQQNEKLKEIAELENQIAQQKTVFVQSLHTFKSQADEWMIKYLLISPTDGTLRFASFLQENQQLQANQVVCFVNPNNAQFYAEVFIPQSNFGKIRQGQTVLLKFPSYPFQEYGSVKGNLDFISNISTDSGYLAKVVFKNGLVTSYKKTVQFREGLTAQAEIVTQDMRLLQRLYYNMSSHVRN